MRVLGLLGLAFAITLAPACGDDGPPVNQDDARPPIDAAVDGAPTFDASCFTDPQTHVEIINACTDAEKVYKTPNLPRSLPDGGLPPLP